MHVKDAIGTEHNVTL